MPDNEALVRLLKAASVVDTGLRGDDDEHPWEAEYALEQLALAARAYVAEVEASDTKPVGWGGSDHYRTHYCVSNTGEPELVFHLPPGPNDGSSAYLITHTRDEFSSWRMGDKERALLRSLLRLASQRLDREENRLTQGLLSVQLQTEECL